jgi:hypothetical protein
MNTLKLTRVRVGGKLRWGWIFCRDGKAQYGSAGFFVTRLKALEHFRESVKHCSSLLTWNLEETDI